MVSWHAPCMAHHHPLQHPLDPISRVLTPCIWCADTLHTVIPRMVSTLQTTSSMAQMACMLLAAIHGMCTPSRWHVTHSTSWGWMVPWIWPYPVPLPMVCPLLNGYHWHPYILWKAQDEGPIQVLHTLQMGCTPRQQGCRHAIDGRMGYAIYPYILEEIPTEGTDWASPDGHPLRRLLAKTISVSGHLLIWISDRDLHLRSSETGQKDT